MGARIKNRSSLFFLRQQHLCASLALICFMIDIKDQHIYLRRQKSCSLLEASVLPWRSSGTVRFLCKRWSIDVAILSLNLEIYVSYI